MNLRPTREFVGAAVLIFLWITVAVGAIYLADRQAVKSNLSHAKTYADTIAILSRPKQ